MGSYVTVLAILKYILHNNEIFPWLPDFVEFKRPNCASFNLSMFKEKGVQQLTKDLMGVGTNELQANADLMDQLEEVIEDFLRNVKFVAALKAIAKIYGGEEDAMKPGAEIKAAVLDQDIQRRFDNKNDGEYYSLYEAIWLPNSLLFE